MSSAAETLSVRDNVSAEEWQVRVDLAACYRLVAMYGWDDLVFTHISAKIPAAIAPIQETARWPPLWTFTTKQTS